MVHNSFIIISERRVGGVLGVGKSILYISPPRKLYPDWFCFVDMSPLCSRSTSLQRGSAECKRKVSSWNFSDQTMNRHFKCDTMDPRASTVSKGGFERSSSTGFEKLRSRGWCVRADALHNNARAQDEPSRMAERCFGTQLSPHLPFFLNPKLSGGFALFIVLFYIALVCGYRLCAGTGRPYPYHHHYPPSTGWADGERHPPSWWTLWRIRVVIIETRADVHCLATIFS